MAIDMFGMVLASTVGWGVGKILDTVTNCNKCGQEQDVRVGNIQENHLGCKNCGLVAKQFTNACNFTIDKNRRIGHVGGSLLGNYSVDDNPKDESWFFKKNYHGWLFFPVELRAIDMLGKQFVTKLNVIDYESGIILAESELSVWDSIYQDSEWTDKPVIPLNWKLIPEDYRNKRVFSIELLIKSELGDVLYQTRRLETLWG